MDVVLREAHGNHGEGPDPVPKVEKVLHGPVQVGAVVPFGAQDDLSVDLQPMFQEESELVHDEAGPVVLQEPHPDLGLRGVDRDVEGRDPLIHQPLKPLGTQVGEGDVAPVGEGEAEIVVPEPEAGPNVPRDFRR